MSSASLMVTPSKPNSPRSRSVMTARDKVAGERRVAGQRRDGDMARHHQTRPRRDAGTEWRQLPGLQPVARGRDDGPAVMRVGGGITQTREVLDRGGHPGPLQPGHHRRAEDGHLRGIVAERADAHGRVVRIGRHVQGRGIDHVDAHGPRLATQREPDPLRERRIADRAEGHVPREGRDGVAERLQLPALEVGADEQGQRRPSAGRCPDRAGPLDRLDQLADLPRRAHVVMPEHGHARGRSGSQPRLDPRGQPVALEGDHHAPPDGHPLTDPAINPRTK